jgi:hypothetical protein
MMEGLRAEGSSHPIARRVLRPAYLTQESIDHLPCHAGIGLIVAEVRFQVRDLEGEILIQFAHTRGVSRRLHPRQRPPDTCDTAIDSREQPLARVDKADAIESVDFDRVPPQLAWRAGDERGPYRPFFDEFQMLLRFIETRMQQQPPFVPLTSRLRCALWRVLDGELVGLPPECRLGVRKLVSTLSIAIDALR